jgi:branched-chain amino acid transport system substrate-binding protein
VHFIGGKAGKANPNLSPVEVGFVNQHGATPAYPEYVGTAEAATDFINNNLGGIDGHPLKLDQCVVQAEEDGQRCAAQFLANKNIHIALWSLGVDGNASFYNTVGGKFPVIVSVAAAGADYTTKDVYELDGGGAAVLAAMAGDAKRHGYKSIAIISSDNPAGKFATGSVLIPDLNKAGIKTKVIYVSDTAPTPAFTSALQAAGAETADATILIPPGAPQCISTYQGLKQLSVTKPVITTYSCYGNPFPQATGGGAKNWEDWGLNENQRIDDSQVNVFKNVMTAYHQSADIQIGSTPKTFGDLLAIARWANAIGPTKLSGPAFTAQIKSWTGPAFMVPGHIHCGHDPQYVGICGDSAAGSTYTGSKWVSLPPYQDVTLTH